jgi:threonine dehydratase
VCCGGGGLTAGCATALAAETPETKVYVVEPAAFNDTGRSLAAGHRVANAPGATSFCDALLAPIPGEITFAINKELLAGAFAVSDREVAHAMAVAFADYKLVVEPGGAVALAAVLSGKYDIEGRNAAVVASGGNVDRETYTAALQQG